jgi:UDPglucose 6-dehydrogenase
MTVGIIGAGYVGLVTGVVLASKGHDVICLDINKAVVNQLKSGKSHIHEAGIDSLLRGTLDTGKLQIATTNEGDLKYCDLIFICVDTPTINGEIDLSHFFEAIRFAAETIQLSDKFISVIVKSTVLPGTTANKAKKLIEDVSGKRHTSFGLAANPEFLREGSAIDDFINAERIIIGTEDKTTEENLLQLYESWDCEKIIVDSTTAEFAKYVNNAFLALLISFSNEMANISSNGRKISFNEVLKIIGADKRLNPIIPKQGRINPEILSYLVPGPGYGGSCLPKDIKAFSSYAESLGIQPYILNAIQKTNIEQPERIISLIEKSIPEPFKKSYLVLGFSHKPNTNDVRQSVSILIIDKLISKGAKVVLHDPITLESAKVHFKQQQNIYYTTDWLSYLNEVDVIIILTPWEEYQKLTAPEHLKKIIGKTIVDTRLLFNKSAFENSTYISY